MWNLFVTILRENDDDNNNEGMEIESRRGTVVGRNIAGVTTSAIRSSSKKLTYKLHDEWTPPDSQIFLE